MKLLTAKQMGELEQVTFQNYKMPSIILMENAAQGFVQALSRVCGGISGKRAGIYCGKGNNGGDGFAIARHLSNLGAKVTVIIGFEPSVLKKDAKINFEIMEQMMVKTIDEKEDSGAYELIVDAIFGTGFRGEISGPEAKMVETINWARKNGAFVCAVDMPSGASAENGSVSKICVRADRTITFGTPKLGQFLYPAKESVGTLETVPISIPKRELEEYDSGYFLLDRDILFRLPQREDNTHKGNYGKVLAVTGSKGMSGACILASNAVLKSGAGMVTAAVPKSIADAVATQFVEVMTLPLPTDGEILSKNATVLLLERLQKQEALLVGCGMGLNENVKHVVGELVTSSRKPMLIDADGINALKGNINILKNKKAPAVLTPHPVEFSRITGHSMEYLKEHRIEAAASFAKEFEVSVVLKGADSIVAHPNGDVYVSSISNSGMATAGSGDVLSGIIAGLLAQGATAKDAANLGVYFHTLAGNLARAEKGEYGMTAGDILNAVPYAMKQALEEMG